MAKNKNVSSSSCPKIYVVNHPHVEPSYHFKKVGENSLVPWNTTGQHKRKFICRNGKYLINDKVTTGELCFWGEYEVGSVADIISTAKPVGIHKFLIPATCPLPKLSKAQNTDPYVFGNHFKNICCGTHNNTHHPDDVILFGHICYDTKDFYLDTVMVVKEVVEIDPNRNDTQYYKASIEPIPDQPYYKIYYRGYNYYENNQYYSFVPCLASPVDYNHIPNLPKIDLKALGFGNITGGQVPVAPVDFNDSKWQRIVETVQKAGWQQGIQVDEVKP